MDSERLGEAAHYVVDQSQPLLCTSAIGLILVIRIRGILARFSIEGVGVGTVGRGRLNCPKEQRGQPGIFFEGSSGAITRASFSGAEYLAKRRAADDLPHVGEEAPLVRFGCLGVAAKRNFPAFGILNMSVATVDLHRRPDAGEDQIGAADAFGR